MKTLSCPLPADLDVLQNNGFRFSIAKLPEVTYFCQEVNLPSIGLPDASVPTPLVDFHAPGDKLNFAPLQISFLIDSSMSNYKAVVAWLIGLGFPQKHEQYKAFMETFRGSDITPLSIGQSDGVLQILTGSNRVSQTVYFTSLQPTSLSSIEFVTDNTDIVYLTATATFSYTYFYFA